MSRQHLLIFGAGLAYIAVSIFLIWSDKAYFSLFPLGLMAIYAAIYHPKFTFLSLGLLAPLSINIEEWTSGFGLFVPTEPLLFGIMFLLVWMQLKNPFLDKRIWRHPIIWTVGFYVLWILITSITSAHPVTSLKFLLAKLWFIIPILIFGTYFLKDIVSIERFVWLFLLGMTIVVLFTVFHHASYRFGEKESHWVMWPFFKDHTIYGAIVALSLPLSIGLFRSKIHTPLLQAVLIGMIVIIITGLYFSYTRAAWLSVIAALGVWLLIRLRIKFSIIAGVTLTLGTLLLISWDRIQMELERNKQEHTTEEFGERLQSATNVSTDASNLERINRWSCAIAMFKERPVMGFGPGTYAFEYARFQEPDNLTIISTNFGDLGNAHSEYLGPLAEMGVLGLLTFLGVVAAIFYSGIRLYLDWPEEDKRHRVLILSMILSLTTYFVHGILNNYLDTDKASIPIWFMSAVFIALRLKLGDRKSQLN
jgi:putative inorganic carbon (HCO3(-)) transporter